MTLHWLHLESQPLYWLGLVRSIVEPRLPKSLSLDIRSLPQNIRSDNPDPISDVALQSPWKVVSWTYTSNSPEMNWNGLWRLRQEFPDTVRVVFASPAKPTEQIRLLEAGAHLLIPDALSLCHWLPKLLATEYPHR